MKQRQSSNTAEGMAILRALEASRPTEKRVCYDPIARSLVSPVAVFLSNKELNAQPSPLLDGPSELFPEVSFEKRRQFP